MNKINDQVSLSRLVFSQNWEDPDSDHQALRIKSGDTVLAITSGGCNVLGFLLQDPGTIFSIDINPAQNFMLALKIAAMKGLSYDEFMAFSGIRPCDFRGALYEKIKPFLGAGAKAFWNNRQRIISGGFLMSGKYERFIRVAGKCIRFIQGRKKVRNLFVEKTLPEQHLYFDRVWNTKRFHYIFRIVFNKQLLARRGLEARYFHFDDGSKSFAESFYNRSKKAFRDNPVKGNYFLSLYLLARYQDETAMPAYLKRENFDVIKSRLDRIQFATSAAQTWLDAMPDRSIDCFALSNICELMSEQETNRLFTSVNRTARADARVIFRNLMIPREVPENLRTAVVKDELLSRQLLAEDRSFVYGKVAAYNIPKLEQALTKVATEQRS